jgi:phage shock protein A
MGIFSRLSDIVNSNLNALLDKAEDPPKLIRLIVQEMEDTLVDVRSDAARVIADRKEIARRLDRLSETAEEWQKRAELALEKNREDLARAALVEKTKILDLAKMIDADDAVLKDRLAELDTDIGRLQAKLTEAKAKQATLLARAATAGARLSVRTTLHDGRVDDALGRFGSFEKKLDDLEGRVEAFDLGKGAKTLADEIADLQTQTQIDEELQRLKESLGKRSA